MDDAKHLLDQPRSVSRARQEIWVPSVLDRAPYVLWEQAGSTDAAERAMARARKLLKTHRPTPLDPAVAAQLDAILAELA
jgi:trimethylamine---corrinoid protein Co-methyltransferase